MSRRGGACNAKGGRRWSESVEGKKEKENSFINKQLSRDTSMTQLEKAGLTFLALVAIISLVFESWITKYNLRFNSKHV